MIAIDSLSTGSTQTFHNQSIYQMFRSKVMRKMSEDTREKLETLITSNENTYHLNIELQDLVYIPFILNSPNCHVITNRYREVYELFKELLEEIGGDWTSSIVNPNIVNNLRTMHERSEVTSLFRELCIYELNTDPDFIGGIQPQNINRDISLAIIDQDISDTNLFSKETIKVTIT